MKKCLIFAAALVAAVSLQAEDVALTPPTQAAIYTAVPGAATQTVTEAGRTLTLVAEPGKVGVQTNAQWFMLYPAGLSAGKTYRVELAIRADRDAGVRLAIFGGEKPWTVFASRQFQLKADQMQTLSLEYTAKADTGIVRIPSLFFGTAPVGTVFTITGVRLFEVK